MALKHGYKVDYFYRAWHWQKDKWSKEVFRRYVQSMLKLKVQNSKFPDNIQTDKQKEKWAKNYKEKFDIDIDLANIHYNEGIN